MSINIWSDQNDHSTAYVMQWLIHYGETPVRYNSEDLTVFQHTIGDGHDNLVFLNRNLNRSSTFWYRRGQACISIEDNVCSLSSSCSDAIRLHLNNEARSYNNALFLCLEENNEKLLTSRHSTFINKIEVLQYANKIGLVIPRCP